VPVADRGSRGLALYAANVAFPTDIRAQSAPFLVLRFSSFLHNQCLLCTGSAQAAVDLELRSKAATVHSLSRQS
jgi:hypothetical protein